MTPFHFQRLPTELQVKILHQLLDDLQLQSLGRMCATNKSISTLSTPILWENIDFVEWKDSGLLRGWDLVTAQGAFFRACDAVMDTDPARWRELAGMVRKLRLVSIPSFGIPSTEHESDWRGVGWMYLVKVPVDSRSVFDVMACFENLEELHFFIKDSLDTGWKNLDDPKKLRGKLMRLKTVEIGGEMSARLPEAILSQPENVEKLTSMTLKDGGAGQDAHSDGIVFLEDIAHRFSKLQTLHLCKLAQLVGDENHTEALGWRWNMNNDLAILKDWAALLRHTSSTLVDVTFEDCYLAFKYKQPVPINHEEQDSDSEHWVLNGATSSRRFRNEILPSIAQQDWPVLERLTFIGIHIGFKTLEKTGISDKLGSRVTINIETGKKVGYNWDATPVSISPPPGPFNPDRDQQSNEVVASNSLQFAEAVSRKLEQR